MSRPRSFVQALIALLSMAAVLLGALEHEDLILQQSLFGGTEVAQATLPTAGYEQLTAVGGESGTEGTFRSETLILATSPRYVPGFTLRLPEPPPPESRGYTHLPIKSVARTPGMGVMALRL